MNTGFISYLAAGMQLRGKQRAIPRRKCLGSQHKPQQHLGLI